MPRPDVAPRPPCRYYNTSRGCFAGAKCHYLHSDPVYAPYEANKTCRFFAQGFCKRGAACWFAHAAADEAACGPEPEPAADDEACGICFEERPALYGLLSGCSHAFCLKCIRQWRDPAGKDDMQAAATHKTCPMCRNMTQYITPSSRHYAQDDPRKAALVAAHKRSMARVPCRHFARSPPEKRFCPFGRDCFYQHANADGTPYEFADGVAVMMAQRQRDPMAAALEVLESIARRAPDEPGTMWPTTDELHGFMMRAVRARRRLARRATAPVVPDAPAPNAPAPTPPDTPPPTTPDPPPQPAGDDAAFPSQDPRTPENASRAGSLVHGDFAWMMSEGGGRGTV